ncbi:MAG: RseA family anti-sigma factor [Pseudomonadales bacterium]
MQKGSESNTGHPGAGNDKNNGLGDSDGHAASASVSSLEASLSALLDGELEELETRRLLQQLEQRPQLESSALLAKWSRYQVAREALVGERGQLAASSGFAQALSRQLENETAPAPVETGSAAFRAPLWSRFAVAASVAVAVVFSVQQYQAGESQAAEQARIAAVEVLSTPGGASYGAVASHTLQPAQQTVLLARQPVVPGSSSSASGATQQGRERLQHYLLQHANNAAGLGAQGIVPFARVANFEIE